MYRDPAAGLQRGVGGIAHEVDQELLELIAVGLDHESRPRPQFDAETRLQPRHPPDPGTDLDRPELRRRELG